MSPTDTKTADCTIPAGMVDVTQDEFFAALKADHRDIMPNHTAPEHTTWETPSRMVWGWSFPGWRNPGAGPNAYAVTGTAIKTA